MSNMLKDLDRLCIHTITTKPWNLQQAVEKYTKAGIKGISIWQDAAESYGVTKAAHLLKESNMDVVSYVRGGFFPNIDSANRQQAIDDNKKLIDDAATLGAELLVLVCGADPKQSLKSSRDQIQSGIEAIIPHAKQAGIRLGIEPLHPMYADTRSAINNLSQANTIAEAINDNSVGIVIDVYHLWWDELLEQEIIRCGQHKNIFAFHTCDWKVPTSDMLNDRGLMGEGCIQTRQIREWVDNAGFNGYIEVEIFSNHYWSQDQDIFLQNIIDSYLQYA